MLFNEEQRFRQKLILLPIAFSGLVILVVLGAGLYSQMVLNKPFGNNPMSNKGLILAIAIILLVYVVVFWLFNFTCLFTRIDREGITIRFRPFHRKPILIRWKEIESYEIVKYNPIGDYGGWGLQSGRKGKAYNVSGNIGLQLILKNQKKILIGTQDKEKMQAFLSSLVKRNPG